jgi:F-type H+-transporting ATPase subunit gamma
LDSLLNNLINSEGAISNPFIEEKTGHVKIGLCVITSDSGLCGLYNNNVIRLADEFVNSQGKEKTKLILIGKKGFNYFKRHDIKILNTYIGLNGRYSPKTCDEITNYLTKVYLAGEVDKIHVAYTHYQRALILKPVINKFVNIDKGAGKEEQYLFEPGKEKILEELIRKYLFMKMRLFILEAFTSEHSARAVAMKTATDNARELLRMLTLLRNKVRQGNITQEIMEVIASAEALKG